MDMRKNFQLRLIPVVIFILCMPLGIVAQTIESAPMAGNGYVIMKSGDTLSGRINWRMKYTENNPAEIKFIPETGSPQILSAADISGLAIYPRTDFEGNEMPQENYVSLPSIKKGTPVFYNRLLDGKLQVFQNRSSVIISKEITEANTVIDGFEFRYSKETGLTVGPAYKTSYRIIESRTRFSSYFIIRDHGAFQKIDRDNYDDLFTSIFSGTSGIL
jgi:hypothetical protein